MRPLDCDAAAGARELPPLPVKDGGPAFPVGDLLAAGIPRIRANPRTGAPAAGGMTLRDKFADSALKGILSNAYWNEHGPFNPPQVAMAAWEYADAMLAAREPAA